MKCGVIRDLVPLYLEGELEPETRKLVEEHLAYCRDCSRHAMRSQLDISDEVNMATSSGARQAVSRVRRRLTGGIALGVIVVLSLGLLSMWASFRQATGLIETAQNRLLSRASRHIYDSGQYLQRSTPPADGEFYFYGVTPLALAQETIETAGRLSQDEAEGALYHRLEDALFSYPSGPGKGVSESPVDGGA